MKRFLWVLLIILLVTGMISCSNRSNMVTSSNQEQKTYKDGEEAFIFDNSGKKIYSLKINGVKTASDFEYKNDFPESNLAQIVELNYTYSNISKNDGTLLIHGADLQIVDSKGTIAESSSMFPKQKPKELISGTNCTVQSYYGLANKSNSVKVIFTSNNYKNNPAIVFNVPVN